jgi:hypothetical protein
MWAGAVDGGAMHSNVGASLLAKGPSDATQFFDLNEAV